MGTAGVALAVLFHALVLLTPAPNYAGGFSISCVSRLLLCLTVDGAARVRLLEWGPLCAAALAAALVPSATCAAFAAVAAALVASIAKRGGAPPQGGGAVATPRPRSGVAVSLAATLTAVYAFGLPILGLQHMGSSSMYANLKHWGGSNHYLVPTGLLQQWYADAPGELGNWFGGGLVRVDEVKGSSLASLNAWATIEPSPTAAELLRAAGHSGRQLAAYYAPGRMASLEAAGHAVSAAALPAVMPAFELRRALASARALGLKAEARVVRLPLGLVTPSEWLAHRGPVLTLRSDGTCSRRTWLGIRRPCGDDAERLARMPLPWPLATLLLPYPAPLLPDDGTEIHCSA